MNRRRFRGLVAVVPTLLATSMANADAVGSDVTWSAYFDAYYNVNFNRPSSASANLGPASTAGTTPQYLPPSQNGSYRNFDIYHNQISLNVAEISVVKKSKEVGFKADFDFGDVTEVVHNSAGAGASGSLDEVSKHIGQAVVSYSPAAAPALTVNVGKMATHMGLETTKARDNWQYSRSILYSVGIPYWHLGVNVAYAWIPSKFATGLYVYNGSNSLNDNNAGKSYGFQAAFTPSDRWAVFYNLITGAEGPGNTDYRTIHDANAVYSLNSALAFSIDGIYGKSNTTGNPNWKAIQLAAKFQVVPHYSISPRIERYWDPQGFTTGTPQSINEITVTQSVPLGEGLETRLETRWDRSSARVFVPSKATEDTQITATWAVLYSF